MLRQLSPNDGQASLGVSGGNMMYVQTLNPFQQFAVTAMLLVY